MEYIQLKGTSLTASRAAFGCMRLAELSVEQAKRQIEHAMELGINFFDQRIYTAAEAVRRSSLKRWI